MGKNKQNAYQIFVRDEHRKMVAAGQNPIYSSLFRELDPKWKSLPEEVRQRYKDRANGTGGGGGGWGGGGGGGWRPQAASTSSAQTENTHQSYRMRYNENNGVKNNESPEKKGPFNFDVKPNVDVKPVIKEERGVKRSLELDIYREPGQEEQSEKQEKRHKPGYGVPNWKNIKNSVHPEGDRYMDFHLQKLRTVTESIVNTRGDSVVSRPMYTFSCNVLCRYKKDGKDISFIPIEIGICAYSIDKGQLGDPYHALINAGPPPQNYFNDSNDHALASHKIKFHPNYPAGARDDYRSIYKEILKYTLKGERTILVADHRDLDQVRLSIEWLYEKAKGIEANITRPTTFTILPMVDFVAASYNVIWMKMLKNPLPKFTLHYFLKMQLECSAWDYEAELMCFYHRKEDNQSKFCARSCAIRAINCIQSVLEEIYEHHKAALEARKPKPAEPHSTQTGSQQSVAKTSSAVAETMTPKLSAIARPSTQKKQQPLYFC